MAENKLTPSWHRLTHICPCCNSDCRVDGVEFASTGQTKIVWKCNKGCEKPDLKIYHATELPIRAHEIDIIAYMHSLKCASES